MAKEFAVTLGSPLKLANKKALLSAEETIVVEAVVVKLGTKAISKANWLPKSALALDKVGLEVNVPNPNCAAKTGTLAGTVRSSKVSTVGRTGGGQDDVADRREPNNSPSMVRLLLARGKIVSSLRRTAAWSLL
jgi:hypothetical protein